MDQGELNIQTADISATQIEASVKVLFKDV